MKEKENQLDYTIAQQVKNLPVIQETWVQSVGQEDPLEKEMATHSSVLACKIPWAEESSGLVYGVTEEFNMTQQLTHTNLHIMWQERKYQTQAVADSYWFSPLLQILK